MKFYFNFNNKAQAEVLKKCGIKNVFINFKYIKNVEDHLTGFDSVMVSPSSEVDPFQYFAWLRHNEDKYHHALQWEDQKNIDNNIIWFKQGLDQRVHGMIPILHQNYFVSLDRLEMPPDYIALGKLTGKIEEDEALRRLPSQYKYHGLGKGRWLNAKIESVDSSTWLSGVRGRKTDVFQGESILFGKKGRTDKSKVSQAYQRHKAFAEVIGLSMKSLEDGDYTALMLATMGLYYMPMFKALGIYDDNIKE